MRRHQRFVSGFVLVILASASQLAIGGTVTFSGDDWTTDNQFRVFIGGDAGTTGWTTFDDGRFNNNGRQQWAWMDVSDAIAAIPTGATVSSATLDYTKVESQGIDISTTTFSIFAVPGDDRGRAAVTAAGADGRDGMDVPDYYGENTPYGAVTGITDQVSAQSFDVTGLVQGWVNGTLTENVGQMMLLWDQVLGDPADSANRNNWVQWVDGADNDLLDAADRPTLTIEFVPEPGALGLMLIGLMGITCGKRR